MTSNSNPGPLDGVRVLDLTHYIAGPYCTKLFADYGVEVVKIERPEGGDATRRMGPFLHDEPHLEKSGLFLHLNTNKKSVTLDIETQAGRNVLLQLAKDADIVVESFSPDFLPSLELDYGAFEAVNPRIVMTSISNFGSTGPYRDYAASEITLYALGGTMISTGIPDREPVKLGLTVEQFYAGMVCATATMGAFMGASLTGEGQHVDMSLMEIMVANQDRAVQGHMLYQYTGPGAGRTGGGSPGRTIVPVGVYPTLDATCRNRLVTAGTGLLPVPYQEGGLASLPGCARGSRVNSLSRASRQLLPTRSYLDPHRRRPQITMVRFHFDVASATQGAFISYVAVTYGWQAGVTALLAVIMLLNLKCR